MILTCCEKEGQHCSTFNCDFLRGRIFRVSHGLEGTEEEQELMRCQLLAKVPLVTAERTEATVATQSTGTAGKPTKKPCGCMKGKLNSQQFNEQRIALEKRRQEQVRAKLNSP